MPALASFGVFEETAGNYGFPIGKMCKFRNYGEPRVIQYWPSSSQGGHDARAGQPEALILISRRFGRLPEIATNGQ